MHVDRRIEGNFKQGWTAAIITVVAAIVINAAVTWFHYEYAGRSPNDVMFRARGSQGAPSVPQEHPAE